MGQCATEEEATMYGDCKEDAALKAAWGSFCDQLKEAGDLVFRENAPNNPVTRATGLRLLARNVALALQLELENRDPLHPELMHYFDPVRKQGGDNTDALYVGAPINGRDTYRISGTRGSAHFLAFTVLENGETPWGGAVIGGLFGPELATDAEGRFEIRLGPDPTDEGNWIKTTPGTYRVTIRQFFADWENEQPMDAVIDRLTGTDELAPVFTPEALIDGLGSAAHWLSSSTRYWAEKLDLWKARPNEFVAFGEMESASIDATPGGTPLISYWKVPPDQALIIRVTPPECSYWACEFGSYWWETMDYRRRLSSTNCHHAKLEADGSLTVVVSHDDPGVPNWLDPSGHDEGYVTFRWIGAEDCPRPSCEQLARSDLAARLGSDVRQVSAEQRREQLAARRRGVQRRFKI
jgi:hypothetical protein